jgi:hypothetical protein
LKVMGDGDGRAVCADVAGVTESGYLEFEGYG